MSHPIPYDDFRKMYEALKAYNDKTLDKPKEIVVDLARVALMLSQTSGDDIEVDNFPSAFWLSVLNTPFVPKRIVDAIIEYYQPKTDDLEIARKIVDLAKTKR